MQGSGCPVCLAVVDLIVYFGVGFHDGCGCKDDLFEILDLGF